MTPGGFTPCDQCRKGWVLANTAPKALSGFFSPCPICLGSGILTLSRLSELTMIDQSTLKRLWKHGRRTRVKTAMRVLDAVVKLTVGEKQKELGL